MIQHDVVSPRTYSRINALCGTQLTFFGYLSHLAVSSDKQHPVLDSKEKRSSHEWTYETEKTCCVHAGKHAPACEKIGELAKKIGGLGGMNLIMNYQMPVENYDD